MEAIKDLSFSELLYGILFQPKKTFQHIAATTPLFQAFLIFVGVNIINSLVGFFTSSTPELTRLSAEVPVQLQQYVSFFTSPPFVLLGTFLGFMFSLLTWFLLSAILHLLAEFFGGQGTGLGVMTVLGCAMLPQVLVVPFEVLIYLLGLPSNLLFVVSLPITIWSQIVLPLLGLRAVHQFSLGRALLTLLTPVILGFVLLTVLVLGLASTILPFFG